MTTKSVSESSASVTSATGATTASADSNSLYAGIARSAVRGLALYFSRPVRLFRPSKASGWTSLRYAAQRDGASLSPQYVAQYIKQHGFSVLPRHFMPPLLINTALGTLLFTSYTAISSEMNERWPNMSSTAVAAISGSGAGAIQALAGAPAENVRLLMESGTFNAATSVSGWRHAWKEVFIDPTTPTTKAIVATAQKESRRTQIGMRLSDVREAKMFANELREMAGRGWHGWGWGFGKDLCGYGLFFAIFDLSRRAAIHTSHAVESIVFRQDWTVRSIIDAFDDYEHVNKDEKNRAPTSARVAQGTVLVSGGVLAGIAYEYVGRPFDAVRREWHIYAATHPISPHSPTPPPPSSPSSPSSHPSPPNPSTQSHIHPLSRPRVVPPLPTLIHDVYTSGGIRAFFHSPSVQGMGTETTAPKTWHARVYPILRTLGRVGPWGVGFLVWEAFGPGIQ